MNNDAIYAIEQTPLMPNYKYSLLLVAAGLRPGAWLNINSKTWINNEEPQSAAKEDVDLIVAAIKASELKYSITRTTLDDHLDEEHPEKNRYMEITYFLVAKDNVSLQRLIDSTGLSVNARPKLLDKELGLALGYPMTAVEAYVNGEKARFLDLPLKVQLEEPAQFILMALSEAHWEEELVVSGAWAEKVKELSPQIYIDAREELGHIDKVLAEKVRAYIAELEAK